MDKSFVSMEQHRCPVCGKDENTGSLLLHRRLSKVLERNTVTGWGLCQEHQKLADDGYVAMIEVTGADHKQLTLDKAATLRTGNVGHIKRELYEDIFDTKLGEGVNSTLCFVEIGILDQLEKLMEEDNK